MRVSVSTVGGGVRVAGAVPSDRPSEAKPDVTHEDQGHMRPNRVYMYLFSCRPGYSKFNGIYQIGTIKSGVAVQGGVCVYIGTYVTGTSPPR